MSPLWRNRYTAVIGPERVTIVRRRRGWRPAFDLKADAPIDGTLPATAAVGEALAGLLARPGIGSGDLDIVLSNLFVRFQLVAWNDDIGTPEELQAFARVGFEQVYGADASRWHVEVSPDATGKPRLAAAIDQELVERLRTVVAASRLRLTSLQPYLTAAFNRFASRIKGKSFLFVVAEPTRTCLLASTGGRWSGVRAGAGGDTPESITNLIERESQLLGLADGVDRSIFVHAPQRARLTLPPVNGIAPATLAMPLPAALATAADPQLAMAMALD